MTEDKLKRLLEIEKRMKKIKGHLEGFDSLNWHEIHIASARGIDENGYQKGSCVLSLTAMKAAVAISKTDFSDELKQLEKEFEDA